MSTATRTYLLFVVGDGSLRAVRCAKPAVLDGARGFLEQTPVTIDEVASFAEDASVDIFARGARAKTAAFKTGLDVPLFDVWG